MEQEKRMYNRIKAVLALKRVKSKALAGHLHISAQTVSKWCTNYSQPSIPELYDIAEFLKVDVIDLLEPMTVKHSQ
jgi:putative transcriptional regulator